MRALSCGVLRIFHMNNENKEIVRSDRVTLPQPTRQVRIGQLRRDELRQERKLPPAHGPTPRFTKVPGGESLPRKK